MSIPYDAKTWYHGICRWLIPETPIYEIKYLWPTQWRGRVSLFTTGDAHILFLLWPCRWALSFQ